MKEEERVRRAEEAIGIIDVMAIPEEIPIPQQGYRSSKNKKHTTVGQIDRSPGSQ